MKVESRIQADRFLIVITFFVKARQKGAGIFFLIRYIIRYGTLKRKIFDVFDTLKRKKRDRER